MNSTVLLLIIPISLYLGLSHSPFLKDTRIRLWTSFSSILLVAVLGSMALYFVANTSIILITLTNILVVFVVLNDLFRNLISPLSAMNKFLAKGEFDQQTTQNVLNPIVKSKWGLGAIASHVSSSSKGTHKSLEFALALEQGRFDYKYEVEGQSDRLGDALMHLQERLNNLIGETNEVLTKVTEEGNLDANLQLKGQDGAWSQIARGINDLVSSFSDPLKDFNTIFHKLSEGDLTMRYQRESKGAMRKMGVNLNTALDNIDGLLGQIDAHAGTIENASVEMKTSGKEMSVNTSEIATSIGEMSRGAFDQVNKINEASSMIESVRSSSEAIDKKLVEINGAAENAVQKSETGIQTMNGLVQSMQEIISFSMETNNYMSALHDRSSEIDKVLQVISDIAAQTNLLALNASIEAAQAGDAGRGFSVVAEEIRTLAESSKKSANEIEALVSAVKGDTAQAASLMKNLNEKMASSEKNTTQASEVFEEILTSSNATLEHTNEIVKATGEQAVNIKDIVKNIEGVVVIAEEAASGAEQVAASASELSTGMEVYHQKTNNLDEVARSLNEGLSMVVLSGKAGSNTAIFKMKEAFEHEKSLLDALLDNMPDTIYFKDLEGRFIRNSKSHALQFGMDTVDDLLGKTDFDFAGESAKGAFEDEQRIINTGEPIVNRIEPVDLEDGEPHFVSTTKLALRNLEGEIIGTFGISRDVTDQMVNHEETESKHKRIREQNEKLERTLDELKNTQQQLIQSEKMASVGILASGVAHEINNPLNFIQGSKTVLSDFLVENLNGQFNEVEPLLSSMQEGLDRTYEIVKRLDRFTQKGDGHEEICDIQLILEDCISLFQSDNSKDLTFDVGFCKEAAITLGNQSELHQMFSNVLKNSHQAAGNGGCISVDVSMDQTKIEIVIGDNGEGIDSKHLDRVTEPFFTTRKPGEGVGLGLSVAYAIVERHGGNIEIESNPGKGTKVRVVLPASVNRVDISEFQNS